MAQFYRLDNDAILQRSEVWWDTRIFFQFEQSVRLLKAGLRDASILIGLRGLARRSSWGYSLAVMPSQDWSGDDLYTSDRPETRFEFLVTPITPMPQ